MFFNILFHKKYSNVAALTGAVTVKDRALLQKVGGGASSFGCVEVYSVRAFQIVGIRKFLEWFPVFEGTRADDFSERGS